MRLKVTDAGVVIPREMLPDVEEVDVRMEGRLVVLTPVLDDNDPIWETKKRGFKKGLMTSLAYLISHESHHRGNILLTLKLAGHRVPQADSYAIWDWDKM